MSTETQTATPQTATYLGKNTWTVTYKCHCGDTFQATVKEDADTPAHC